MRPLDLARSITGYLSRNKDRQEMVDGHPVHANWISIFTVKHPEVTLQGSSTPGKLNGHTYTYFVQALLARATAVSRPRLHLIYQFVVDERTVDCESPAMETKHSTRMNGILADCTHAREASRVFIGLPGEFAGRV